MAKILKKAWHVAGETWTCFREDDGFTLAAALSFYAILTLVPLSLIVFSLIGHWLGRSEEALAKIIELVTGIIPSLTPPVIGALTSIINRQWTSGWIGGMVLVFIASVLFTNLERVLDKVFRALRSRNFFHSRLLSVAFIFMTALLFFIPAVLKRLDESLLRHHIPISFTPLITGDLFFFLVGWVSFVLIVAVVPHHRVELKYNISGGLAFAVLLVIAKYLFRWYTDFSLVRLNLVYGWMTALILIILWIFYLMNLLILCAEWVAVLQRKGREKLDS
jgi:membrane protein